jgi:hypothetical protein
MKKTQKTILLTWILCLSAVGACGSLQIKTWLIDANDGSLVRTKNGVVIEKQSYTDANGYRCYSPIDDEAWRARMATLSACCPGR